MSKTLAELADEIWTWQQEAFGDGCTVHGAIAKLSDEVQEVLKAWKRLNAWQVVKRSPPRAVAAVREELADVFFMLVQLAGAASGGPPVPLFEDGGYYTTGAPMAYWLARIEVRAGYVRRLERESVGTVRRCFTEWWVAQTLVGGDIRLAIEAKLAKNRGREWGKPAADGTISHTKEASNG